MRAFLLKISAETKKMHSCPIKSWKKEKCTVARRGGCRRARSGCANEPQGNRLADAHKEL